MSPKTAALAFLFLISFFFRPGLTCGNDSTAAIESAAPVVDPADAAGPTRIGQLEAKVDAAFAATNAALASVLFFPVCGIPLTVFWLIAGASFFTLRLHFISLRGLKHAVMATAGCYDDPTDTGEVNHFQALTAALSATVGLGNIAGVAIAISIGGPGATFWMIVAGFLGMSSKFVECTLGQKYREIRPDGRVMGGAMFYLSRGLRARGLGRMGNVLATVFATLCVGGSLAGGNAFQINQSLHAVSEAIPFIGRHAWVYGLLMAFLVGAVIVGGIRRISATTEMIVPLMCGIYVIASAVILAMNVRLLPAGIAAIASGAFSPHAAYGGVLGVLIIGFQRAAFSNEAGVGSAPIAHSAAKTAHPIREGMVALLEPLIDTVIVCTMTALVIVVTGAYVDPAYADVVASREGAALTSRAMSAAIPGFQFVLALCVVLFAFSSAIAWSYYGERCWCYLLGDRASLYYRLLFLVFVFLGSVVSATNVLNFGDLMILGMAFPNILGMLLLCGEVKSDLDEYWKRYKSGEFNLPESDPTQSIQARNKA